MKKWIDPTKDRNQYGERYPKRFNKIWDRSFASVKKHQAYEWWKKGFRAGKTKAKK